MSFLKNLFSRSSTEESDSNLYYFYVQCDRCSEKIRAHVDMRNDLSIRYGDQESDDVYFTRKRIIGSQRCFTPIEVEMTFDSRRRLFDQQITGGQFITEEEFLAE
ncbi:MAG: hypothetical protein GTO18_14730 [Anaerolineales bacterium]|nr:hypothetical protein [Anaerolineales bacterium]